MGRILLLFSFLTFNLSLPGQNYLMNGSPINDCSGFFLDSGGGANNYGANQNFTTTICSDGSTGTHIQLVFSGVDLMAGDELCFFDGPNAGFPSLMCASDFTPGVPFIVQATAANSSGCLTLTFNSDASGQGAGWSADINCIPACQLIQAELVSTNPVVNPPDTGYIDICPGERVFLTGTGIYPQNGVVYVHSNFTSSFTWDFGDGTFAVGPNTSHIYEEPGGYVIQLTIEDQYGCRNTNFLSQRVRVSTYPDFELAGDIPDEICAGDTVSLAAAVSTIDSTFEVSVVSTEGSFQTAGVRSDSLPLPDGTGATYSTSIMFSAFSPGQILTNINDLLGICVNMEHSWMHDLQIELTCPSGTTVVLQDQVFLGGVFLGEPNEADEGMDPPLQGVGYDYCWTPNATNGNWTQYWQATGVGTMPEGDYNSFQSLDVLLGCPLNGEWTLTVQDLWAIDNGWIFEWSIGFDPSLYPNIETFNPQIVDYTWNNNASVIYFSQDSIQVSPQNAGTPNYTFQVTDEFGCVNDTTVIIDVLPPTHPDCHICDIVLPELQDTSLCNGESAAYDASPVSSLDDQNIAFEAFSNIEFDNSDFSPGNPLESTIDISYINPGILTDATTQIVSVCVNLQHTFDADVELRLRAPNGTVIELSTDNGGGGDNYSNTCFTPLAATPITAGTAPFTGNFLPEGSWAAFNGSAINGTWTLLVADDQNGFSGTFLDWSITFVTSNSLNYFWSPGTNLTCNNCPDPVATPLTSTDYILNTVDVYGCANTDTVSIEVYNSFAAPDLNCGNQENGELTINWFAIPGALSYIVSLDGGTTWIPANGVLSHTVSGLSINDIVNIMVQAVSNNVNCPSEIAAIQCQYIGCALTVDAVIFDPTCWNTSDGMISLSASNGQAPVTYSLDNGAPQGPNFSGISAGSHSVLVTDNAGCAFVYDFILNAPDTLFLSLQIDSVSCNSSCDGQAIATGSGGTGTLNYTWSTNPPILSGTADDLCAGAYQVSVTDQNGCQVAANADVFEPTTLLLQTASTLTSCVNTADGSATVVASGGTGGYIYLWNDGNTQNTATANNLTTGNYCVTVTDSNNCTAVSCVDVSTPNPLVVNAIVETPVECFGEQNGQAAINVSGGTGPGTYTYQWDDPLAQTGNPATLLNAGIYNVVVTDANGCTIASSIEVTQPAILTATINLTNVTCYGGNDGLATAIPNGGTAPYTYLWSDFDNQTTATANNLIVGLYVVTVTDANGCTTTSFVDVNQPLEISTTLTQTYFGCSGAMENIAIASASGGAGGFSYEWSNGSTTNVASGLNASAYLVTVTDLSGCEAVDLITITELQPITANIIFTEPSCFNVPDGQLAIDLVSGGVGMGNLNNYNYLWNTTPAQNTASIDNLTGDLIYVVTVSDAQGCTGVESIILHQPSEIILTMSAAGASCFGLADGEVGVEDVQGDNTVFTFQWDNNTGNQTTQFISNLPAGIYFVTVTDTDGCSAIGQSEVDQPASMTIGFDQVNNDCSGFGEGMLTANVSGGVPAYNYQWQNGATSQTITNLNSGVYEITITDANGCQLVDSSSVTGPPPITAEVFVEDVSCFGDRDGSILIDLQGGTPPYLFSLDQENYSGSNLLYGLTAGTYDIFVMDNNGCEFNTTAEVGSPLEFFVDAGPDIVEIQLGDSIQLIPTQYNGVGFVDFVWNAPYEGTLSCESGTPGCFTPWSVTQDMIIYELYGTDDNGCEDTDQITVRVIKDRQVHVPTGFSPNNDQINDVLLVHGKEGTIIRVFRVYDRWGSLVFEANDFEINDQNAGWDGTFKGQPMNPGVFVWYLEAEYIDGLKDIYKGNTTLLK